MLNYLHAAYTSHVKVDYSSLLYTRAAAQLRISLTLSLHVFLTPSGAYTLLEVSSVENLCGNILYCKEMCVLIKWTVANIIQNISHSSQSACFCDVGFLLKLVLPSFHSTLNGAPLYPNTHTSGSSGFSSLFSNSLGFWYQPALPSSLVNTGFVFKGGGTGFELHGSDAHYLSLFIIIL